MDTQKRFILSKVLLCIIWLVPVIKCAYWEVSQVRLDLNVLANTGYTTASTQLSCSRFCDRPQQNFAFFYFSQESQLCSCSKEGDIFPEDHTKEPVFFGQLKSVKDCLEYNQDGYKQDGIYMIEPNRGLRTTAWCDMKNGGWTVIQRRLDGSVDFYRNWTEYVRGFGDPNGEYWIGLDNIHYLTNESPELHIYLETFGDVSPVDGYAWYNSVSVANSSLNYRLTVDSSDYDGNINGHAFLYSHNLPFSTYDMDNDGSSSNCAIVYRGAWWHRNCSGCNLNGVYSEGQITTYADGIVWSNPWGFSYSLKRVIMKVKRVGN